MEQVKGVNYSLNEFLGPAYWQRGGPEVQLPSQSSADYEKSLLVNKDTDLFHCVIYLAPGESPPPAVLRLHQVSLGGVTDGLLFVSRGLPLLPLASQLDGQLPPPLSGLLAQREPGHRQVGCGSVCAEREGRLRGSVGSRLLLHDTGGSHERGLHPRVRGPGASDQLHQAEPASALLRPLPHLLFFVDRE